MRPILAGVILLAGCIINGHAASRPAYKPTPESSVTVSGSRVKIAAANYRIVSVYSVDGVHLKQISETGQTKVDPGERIIGVHMIDRAAVSTGRFAFKLEANRKYRIEADRNPGMAKGSVVGVLAGGLKRMGLEPLLESDQRPYSFRIKLIEETDGKDVVVSEIATILTESFEKLRNGY